MEQKQDVLLAIPVAAVRIQRSVTWLYKLARDGEIAIEKHGNSSGVRESEIDRYLEKRGMANEPQYV